MKNREEKIQALKDSLYEAIKPHMKVHNAYYLAQQWRAGTLQFTQMINFLIEKCGYDVDVILTKPDSDDTAAA